MEKERKAASIDRCPECKSQNLVHDYDSGETVCANCGLVIREQMMDRGPEWRAFTDEERATRTRVGMPTTYSVHDKGLSTGVGGGPLGIGYDFSGKKIPLETRFQMWRLRKWQIRTRVHGQIERNLAQAMNELERLCDKLIIPAPVKEKAAVIYRKALEKRIVRGRSINAMITAALYVACRSTGTQRTLQEIAEASLIDKKEIARVYRLLLRELEMQMPVTDPIAYISKIAGLVGISGQTQGIAIKIIQEAKKKRIPGGKDPIGLAATVLYIAGLQNKEKVTQRDVAEAAGVTEVTIRNRCRELEQRLGFKIPKQKSFKNRKNQQERQKFALFFCMRKLALDPHYLFYRCGGSLTPTKVVVRFDKIKYPCYN